MLEMYVLKHKDEKCGLVSIETGYYGRRQPNSCAVPGRRASQGRIRRRHDDHPPSPQTADLWQHQNTDDP